MTSEVHFGLVVIPTSDITEIIYDTSTETETANKKSRQLLGDTAWQHFKCIRLFHIKFLKDGALCGKSYYIVLIGNYTLALDRCHF